MDAHTPPLFRSPADRPPRRRAFRSIGVILRPLCSGVLQPRTDAADRAPTGDMAGGASFAPAWPGAREQAFCEQLMADLRAADADAPADREDAAEIVDSFAFHAAISDTARDEPATVAQARALLADPQAALAEPELERQVAWLVALADLQHRRADAARCGGTAA